MNFARTSPSQTPPIKGPLTPQVLYVWSLFSLQNTGRRPNIKNCDGAQKFFMLNIFTCFISGTKNQPKEKVFGTDIPRTSGGHSRGYPDRKLRSGRPKSWKNKHWGADIHDPKARTSTTLRDFQKLRSEKLWAEFSFPNTTCREECKALMLNPCLLLFLFEEGREKRNSAKLPLVHFEFPAYPLMEEGQPNSTRISTQISTEMPLLVALHCAPPQDYLGNTPISRGVVLELGR